MYRLFFTGSSALQGLRSLALLSTVATNCSVAIAQPATSTFALERPIPAETFSASVGINVHINYFDRLYGDFNLVKMKLAKLSIVHVRDGAQLISNDYDSLMYGRWAELQQQGVKFNAVVDPRGSIKVLGPSALTQVMQRANGAIESFEGPNEMDISSIPNWPTVVLSYQSELVTTMQSVGPSLRRSIIGPSFAFVANGLKTNGLSAKGNFGNLHSYPAGEMPSHVFPEQTDSAKKVFGNLPIVMTETGYHNALNDKHDQPAVPEDVAAKYIPRIYLENFLHGIVRTYLYELFDEASNPKMDDNQLHWGLIRSDGTEKPAFRSLEKLMTLLKDGEGSYPSQTDSPTLSISGNLDHIHHLYLKKHDGTYCLLLWQEVSVYDTAKAKELVNPARSIGVTFSKPSNGSIHDLVSDIQPMQSFRRKSQTTIQVPDYPVVLEFKPIR
jgi:hypothetical protein